MAPLIVLLILFAILTPFGVWNALRFALAGMFLLTASAHWGKRRADLVRMVPPPFPSPSMLVTLTGIFEIVVLSACFIPPTVHLAAIGLALMLAAMLPANVYAARQHLSIAGKPVLPALPRTLVQLVFLAAVVATLLHRYER